MFCLAAQIIDPPITRWEEKKKQIYHYLLPQTKHHSHQLIIYDIHTLSSHCDIIHKLYVCIKILTSKDHPYSNFTKVIVNLYHEQLRRINSTVRSYSNPLTNTVESNQICSEDHIIPYSPQTQCEENLLKRHQTKVRNQSSIKAISIEVSSSHLSGLTGKKAIMKRKRKKY